MLTPISKIEPIRQYVQPPDNVQEFPFNPLDVPVETFKSAIKRREDNLRELEEWVRKNFVPDIDYGSIHINEKCLYARTGTQSLCSDCSHWTAPVLFKPGAEKVINLLGLIVFFPNARQFEMAAAHRVELNEIVLKCELRTSSGKVVSEGVGARSSSQDSFNLNTTLKLAAKAAVIHAVLNLINLSSIYRFPVAGKFYQPPKTEKPISKRQLELILQIAGKKGLTSESLNKLSKSLFKECFKEVNREQASKLIKHLNSI